MFKYNTAINFTQTRGVITIPAFRDGANVSKLIDNVNERCEENMIELEEGAAGNGNAFRIRIQAGEQEQNFQALVAHVENHYGTLPNAIAIVAIRTSTAGHGLHAVYTIGGCDDTVRRCIRFPIALPRLIRILSRINCLPSRCF